MAQDHYVSGYSRAALAATWEAFSFHSASCNGAVGDAYDAGNISAGQAATQYTANTASAAKDAALTYGTGGIVGKAAQAYARAEAVVDTGEALANGDVKGAALSSLALIPGRGGSPSGKSAAMVNQETKIATEAIEEANVATKRTNLNGTKISVSACKSGLQFQNFFILIFGVFRSSEEDDTRQGKREILISENAPC